MVFFPAAVRSCGKKPALYPRQAEKLSVEKAFFLIFQSIYGLAIGSSIIEITAGVPQVRNKGAHLGQDGSPARGRAGLQIPHSLGSGEKPASGEGFFLKIPVHLWTKYG